jgi:hypothetical protein
MALRYRAAKDSDRGRDAALDVMLWARAILDADEDVVVSVSAHRCSDPQCGDPGTFVLLMRPGKPTEAVKLGKSIETVTRADVAKALQQFAPRRA